MDNYTTNCIHYQVCQRSGCHTKCQYFEEKPKLTGDLISRSALKESIRKRLGISSLEYLTEQEKVIVDEIENAPPVERPQGRRVDNKRTFH